MIEALEFLWPSFLVAVCLVGIHVYFGIQVLARNVIFVDLALAQIAALGATVAFMLGHPAQSLSTYGYSLAFTSAAALLLAFTRGWAKQVSQEALIGVIYVVAAAASILLIDRAPQGAEHLKQILTGNILTSGVNELAVIVPLYVAVALVHFLLRKQVESIQLTVVGIPVLFDIRRGRDQFGRARGRAAGVFFPDHPRNHRRDIRLVGTETTRGRMGRRHADECRRACGIVCDGSADWRGHGVRVRHRTGAGGDPQVLAARRSARAPYRHGCRALDRCRGDRPLGNTIGCCAAPRPAAVRHA